MIHSNILKCLSILFLVIAAGQALPCGQSPEPDSGFVAEYAGFKQTQPESCGAAALLQAGHKLGLGWALGVEKELDLYRQLSPGFRNQASGLDLGEACGEMTIDEMFESFMGTTMDAMARVAEANGLLCCTLYGHHEGMQSVEDEYKNALEFYGASPTEADEIVGRLGQQRTFVLQHANYRPYAHMRRDLTVGKVILLLVNVPNPRWPEGHWVVLHLDTAAGDALLIMDPALGQYYRLSAQQKRRFLRQGEVPLFRGNADLTETSSKVILAVALSYDRAWQLDK